jgi:predicted outer membrane protein
MKAAQRIAALSVAAVTVALVIPLVGPNPASASAWPAVATADRDLIIRVRLAGLWEQPAGQLALKGASSENVRDIGARIAGEHHELDQAVLALAGKLNIGLPDAPTAEQQSWLDEIGTARGPELDRIFVERLRAAHGKVFGIIAAVRAGTRDDDVRAFANTANSFVSRHLGYLDSTGLVNYPTLPLPTPASGAASESPVETTPQGAIWPADLDLLGRLREEALWRVQAATVAATRGNSPSVRALGALIADSQRELDDTLRSVALQLGLDLPNSPNAEQRGWLNQVEDASGDDFDRVFVQRLRASSGALFTAIAQVRSGSRNSLVRAFAATANDAVLLEMNNLESTGLVDFTDLPRPMGAPNVRVPATERDGGIPTAGIGGLLAAAILMGAVSIVRLARAR